jgi:hypothetical protein
MQPRLGSVTIMPDTAVLPCWTAVGNQCPCICLATAVKSADLFFMDTTPSQTVSSCCTQVVDASGCTDREGQAVQEGEGADPVDDVGWVKHTADSAVQPAQAHSGPTCVLEQAAQAVQRGRCAYREQYV